MVLNRLKNDRRPYALYAFLWAFLLSAVIIIPIMVYDKGYFLYYGDFNVQEIPFYQLAHDSIRSGNTGWSHLTDLGSNFVGSYSFYLLGSPFFWLTVPLPSSWVAYTFGPLLMLKLAFSSLSAYIYLRRYVRQQRSAMIGGVIYAFSSFSVYNIFFFHFHEAIIVFPLLLAALDDFHDTKRRGVMTLAVFLSATVNYYFFIGQVIFVIIYYVIKMISKSYRFRLRDFIYLAIECILGFCMSFFLFLPSIAAIMSNSRLSDIINGWDVLLYAKSQRYVQIFVSLFFPGDIPAKNNFTPSAGGKWSSVAAYLPMFSMTFVIGYLRTRKHAFFRRLVLILLLMAAVPGLNSLFQLLNSAYYARWFYMLTLMMTAVTVRSLDEPDKVDFNKGFMPTAIITLITATLIGFMPEKIKEGTEAGQYSIGIESSTMDYWIMAAFAIVGLALTYLIWYFYRKKPKLFFRIAVICLTVFVLMYTETYLWVARRYADRKDDFMISYALNGGEDITLRDIKDVRSDFYNTSDNMGMFWQVPNIQAFHSIVPGSLMNFYNSVGVERNVGSRPAVEYYGLRGLLSVKYFFIEHKEDVKPPETTELMPGYRYVDTQNGFNIYENEYYIPMGFTYDQFICQEEFYDISEKVRHLTLLKSMVLTQAQMEKYADITGYKAGMYDWLNETYDTREPLDVNNPKYVGLDSITTDFRYDKNAYFEDAQMLKQHTCSSFEYTSDGFTATFNNSGDDNLLFFSVPYDEGWTATVNGEDADIEEVNIGFMAVRVKGHETSEVRFTYRTPYLKTGCIVSGAAAAVFILYLILNQGFRAQRRSRRIYRIKQKQNNK
ncbi:MAG: YfhO family protein [Ruminococcus sp.]|nr:YfhO family protein [Ruminococcus sp.]